MFQPVTNKDIQLVQQPINALVLGTLHVIISLSTYVPRHSDHQPLNGRQPENSP
jgi:hypothetical protein